MCTILWTEVSMGCIFGCGILNINNTIRAVVKWIIQSKQPTRSQLVNAKLSNISFSWSTIYLWQDIWIITTFPLVANCFMDVIFSANVLFRANALWMVSFHNLLLFWFTTLWGVLQKPGANEPRLHNCFSLSKSSLFHLAKS